MDILRLVAIVMTGCTLLAMGVVLGQPTAGPGERERLEKLFKAGNFKDAYDGYRRWRSTPKTSPTRFGPTLNVRSIVWYSWVESMRSTHSAKPSLHCTRGTGGCSRRLPPVA